MNNTVNEYLSEEMLGQSLSSNLFSVPCPRDAKRAYRRSLGSEPDYLLFHGAPDRDEARQRFEYVKYDVINLVSEHDLGDTSLVVFQDEYKWLNDELDQMEEGLGLDIFVSDLEPYPGYEGFKPVNEMAEPGESVRTYTSRSNKRKLERSGEIILDDIDLTVFGLPSESDSLLRKLAGELDFHGRQKRGARRI